MKLYILLIKFFIFSVNIVAAQSPIFDTKIDAKSYPEISMDYLFIPELGNYSDSIRLKVNDGKRECLISKIEAVTPLSQITINYFMSNPDFIIDNKTKKEKAGFIDLAKRLSETSNIKTEQFFYSIENDSINPRILYSQANYKEIDSLNCNSGIQKLKSFYSRNRHIYTNKDVLIFQISDSDFENFQLLIAGFFENFLSNQKLVIIIYDKIVTQKDQKIITNLDPPLIIISKDYYDKNVKDHFMSFLSPWVNRSYKTKFIDSDDFSFKENRIYNLDISLGEKKYNQKFSVQLSKTLIHKRYKDASSNEAEFLAKENRYVESLNKLKSRNDTFNSKGTKDSIYFNKIAHEKIIQYGNYLYDNKADSSLFKFQQAEKIWGALKEKDYEIKKEKVLNLFFSNLENIEGKEDERFLIAESLKNNIPSEVNKSKSFKSKGDIHNKKKEFWQAAGAYKKAIESSKAASPKIVEARSNAVVNAANQSYSKRNFEELYQNGTNYLPDIYSNFTTRLYFAIACKETNHYSEAFNEFDWLVKNWQKQDIMSWDEAMNSLSLLSSSSDYNRSLSISKQIFLDSKTSKSGFQKDGLMLYLLNARAKFYQPLIEIFPIACSSVKAVSIKNLNPPDELTYMGIVDRSLNEINSFLSKEKLFKSNILSTAMSNEKAFFVYEKDGSKGWLVNKLDNSRYFIIQINNKVNTAIEKSCLERIFIEPLSGENWDNLYAIEEEKGFRFLAKSVTSFVEIGLSNNKNLVDFWNCLKKHDDYIKYMIFHEKGKSNITFGKSLSQSDYLISDWQRSSQTTALYGILINKEEKVFNDISNPILVKGKSNCVLRIGLQKKE